MKKIAITSEEILGLVLIAAGVLLRTLPHPDNFTPLTAIALFSGLLLRPRLALWVPLVAIAASDFFQPTHELFWLTWGCFYLTTLVGIGLRGRMTTLPVIAGTLTGTLIFFVLTNLGVFVFQEMYPKTLAGLMECYVMALPFVRNAVVGDLVYAGVFYLVYRLITARRPLRADATR